MQSGNHSTSSISLDESQDEMEIQRIFREIIRLDKILTSFAQSNDNAHEKLVYVFIDKTYKNILEDGRMPRGTLENHAGLIRTAIDRAIKELKITELVMLVYDSRNHEYSSSPDFDSVMIDATAARLRRASQRKGQRALIIPIRTNGLLGDCEDVAYSLTQEIGLRGNLTSYIENIKKLTLNTHWHCAISRQHNESTAKYLCRVLEGFPNLTTLYLNGCSTAYRVRPDLLLTSNDQDSKYDKKSRTTNVFKDKEKITSLMDKDILDQAGITEIEQIFLETYGMNNKGVEHECRLILSKLASKTFAEIDAMTTEQQVQEVLNIFTSISTRIGGVLGKNIYFPIQLCLLEELNDIGVLYHSSRYKALGPEERKFYKKVLPMLRTQTKELPEDDYDSLATVTTHMLEKQPWILSRAKMFVKGHLFNVYTSSRTITEGDETSDSMKLHGCKVKYLVNKKN